MPPSVSGVEASMLPPINSNKSSFISNKHRYNSQQNSRSNLNEDVNSSNLIAGSGILNMSSLFNGHNETLRESKSFSQQASLECKNTKRKTKTMVMPIQNIREAVGKRKSNHKKLRQSNTDVGGLTARFGPNEEESFLQRAERVSLPSVFSRRESIDKDHALMPDYLFSGEAVSTEEESERFQNSRQQTIS